MKPVPTAFAVLLTLSGFAGADGLEDKINELETRHLHGSEAPKDFEFREDEANEYLRSQSASELPEGVESPWIRFEDSLAVVGATLDIDKLRNDLPESAIFQLLSGRVPVELTARLNAAAGVGKLALERVLLAGVELPPDLILALVEGQDTSGILPPGFRIGEAFTLPFDLESIDLTPGSLRIRQRATTKTK